MAKVFIAEDEESIRKLLKNWLKTFGHELVLEAGTFEEAMEMADRAAAYEVALAIVDGSLKTANDGEGVAELLRQNVPGIKIIGHSAHGVSFGDRNLQKPVSSRDFKRTLFEIGF